MRATWMFVKDNNGAETIQGNFTADGQLTAVSLYVPGLDQWVDMTEQVTTKHHRLMDSLYEEYESSRIEAAQRSVERALEDSPDDKFEAFKGALHEHVVKPYSDKG